MKYQLLVFLFALFLICTPNFLLKKKFILQEIVYSALFSIILYFTYDILKINLETFWYECNGELTKMTSPAPCSEPEPEEEPPKPPIEIARLVTVNEGENCNIPTGARIEKAYYHAESSSGTKSKDVTDIVKKLYKDTNGNFNVNNLNMQSDPLQGTPKKLIVSYTIFKRA